jgi:hypothetical protein
LAQRDLFDRQLTFAKLAHSLTFASNPNGFRDRRVLSRMGEGLLSGLAADTQFPAMVALALAAF